MAEYLDKQIEKMTEALEFAKGSLEDAIYFHENPEYADQTGGFDSGAARTVVKMIEEVLK